VFIGKQIAAEKEMILQALAECSIEMTNHESRMSKE
jgi:hypothetical protein